MIDAMLPIQHKAGQCNEASSIDAQRDPSNKTIGGGRGGTCVPTLMQRRVCAPMGRRIVLPEKGQMTLL